MNSRKSARSRWSDPTFRELVEPLIKRLVAGTLNLSGVDLAGVTVGNNGPVQELWNANLFRAQIKDTNMSDAVLSCSINEANLESVRLVGAELDRCLLKKSRITKCDLSSATLVVNLDDSIFEECKFVGASLLSGKAGNEFGGRRVKFFRCDFTDGVFNGVELRASEFIDCNFDGAKFTGCDLRGVKAEGGTLPLASQFEKMKPPLWASTAK